MSNPENIDPLIGGANRIPDTILHFKPDVRYTAGQVAFAAHFRSLYVQTLREGITAESSIAQVVRHELRIRKGTFDILKEQMDALPHDKVVFIPGSPQIPSIYPKQMK